METVLHKSNTRGVADHGWLNSYHSFSFANYYNPERMGFGALRVINDDTVAPSMGFGTHPHRDMEIISIPLSGELKHKDTIGNDFVIKPGEVQTMSAGTGIMHSEYNNSEKDDVNFLQIWVMPKQNGIAPAYSQKDFNSEERENAFQLVVSPDGRNNSATINQDAFFSMSNMQSGSELKYSHYLETNGSYIFVLKGRIEVDGQTLEARDGLGVVGHNEIQLKANEDSEILIMEVPV
jgi:redox-sensitive bicupin YhaK (pirin superfamily)